MTHASPIAVTKKSSLGFERIDLFYLFAGMLFFLFSFWDGLFFDKSFSVASIYMFGLMIAFIVWLKKSRISLSAWLSVDYLMIAYFGLYVISTFAPANMQDAVLGCIRCIAYFSFYLLIRVIGSVSDKKHLLFNGLMLSGLVFALYAIANGFGTLHDSNAIYDPKVRRLASVFQYSNTFAIYEAVTYLLAVTLAVLKQESFKWRLLYSSSAYVMMVSIVLSYSRGTWLALVLMLLLQIILAPKQHRLQTALHAILPVLGTVATVTFITKATNLQLQGQGWGSLFGGLVVILVLNWMSTKLMNRLNLNSRQIKWTLLGGSVAVVIAVVVVIAKIGLPQNLAQRITSINLQQFSVVQRFLFYKDGLKILGDHPVLGGGANAWSALYQHYQTYPYVSRQAHSFIIDNIMDIGILGGLVFIVLFVMLIVRAFRHQKQLETNARFYQSVLLTSFIGLLVHGAIDFDFSYGSIEFMFWGLAAMMLPALKVEQPSLVTVYVSTPSFQKWLSRTSVVLSLIGLLVSGSYLLSLHYTVVANNNKNNPTAGLSAMQKVTTLAPYGAANWLSRAQFEEVIFAKSNGLRDKNNMLSSLHNAVSVAPNDGKVLFEVSQKIGKYSDGVEAIDLAHRSFQSAPYEMKYAAQYLVFADSAGTQLYQGDQKRAKSYFTVSLDTYHDVEQRIANFKNLPPVLKPEYAYDITTQMRSAAGEAAYYLGQYDEAKRILQPALQSQNSDDKQKCEALLAAIAGKQNSALEPLVKQAVDGDQAVKQLLAVYTKVLPIQ